MGKKILNDFCNFTGILILSDDDGLQAKMESEMQSCAYWWLANNTTSNDNDYTRK